MAKKPASEAAYARINAWVSLDTAAKLDAARAALKRQNVWVSASSFVEIAVLELLSRRDLPEVLRKRGATARREPV